MANAGVSNIEYANEQNIIALMEQHINIDLLNVNHKMPPTGTVTSNDSLVCPITPRTIDLVKNFKLKKHLTGHPTPMNNFFPTSPMNHSDQAICARYNYSNGQFRASIFSYGEY